MHSIDTQPFHPLPTNAAAANGLPDRPQAYRAPEITSPSGYEPFAVDVWALGVVTFSLIAGFFPVQVSRRRCSSDCRCRSRSVTPPQPLSPLRCHRCLSHYRRRSRAVLPPPHIHWRAIIAIAPLWKTIAPNGTPTIGGTARVAVAMAAVPWAVPDPLAPPRARGLLASLPIGVRRPLQEAKLDDLRFRRLAEGQADGKGACESLFAMYNRECPFSDALRRLIDGMLRIEPTARYSFEDVCSSDWLKDDPRVSQGANGDVGEEVFSEMNILYRSAVHGHHTNLGVDQLPIPDDAPKIERQMAQR